MSPWTFQVGLNVRVDEMWVDVMSRYRLCPVCNNIWVKAQVVPCLKQQLGSWSTLCPISNTNSGMTHPVPYLQYSLVHSLPHAYLKQQQRHGDLVPSLQETNVLVGHQNIPHLLFYEKVPAQLS
jgi:hypothetical protein